MAKGGIGVQWMVWCAEAVYAFCLLLSNFYHDFSRVSVVHSRVPYVRLAYDVCMNKTISYIRMHEYIDLIKCIASPRYEKGLVPTSLGTSRVGMHSACVLLPKANEDRRDDM